MHDFERTSPPRSRAVSRWSHSAPAQAAAAVVRGVGQVDFQGRLATGVVMTVALFSASWQIGVFALVGSATEALTARGFGGPRERTLLGLDGFSGALTGIASYVLFGWHWSTWFVAIGGAVACHVVTRALDRIMSTWQIPGLTAPFCIVSGILAISAAEFSRIEYEAWESALPRPDRGPTALSATDVLHAFFANVAQVFLVDKWWAGAIMLVALLLGSRWAAMAAATGSVVAIATSWALGAPADQVRDGLFGYNAVLVVLALAAAVLPANRRDYVYAVLGAVCATVVAAAMSTAFAPFGGHIFTWPFVLTTWTFLAAAPSLPVLNPSRSR